MDTVERPNQKEEPVDFYESEDVEKIVSAQPSDKRRALMALVYGTGMDLTPAVEVLRADVNPDTREVRCRGTKTKTRDRIVRVADWAWEIFWPVARLVHPSAQVFGKTNRWTASDWHRLVVKDLAELKKLSRKLPIRKARHHWAVRSLRAGVPVQVVSAQLGHSNATMTLEKYGRFASNSEQRSHWEQKTAEFEARRRAGGMQA